MITRFSDIQSVPMDSFIFRQEWTKNFILDMIACKSEYDLKVLWMLNKHKFEELKYLDRNGLWEDLKKIKEEFKQQFALCQTQPQK